MSGVSSIQPMTNDALILRLPILEREKSQLGDDELSYRCMVEFRDSVVRIQRNKNNTEKVKSLKENAKTICLVAEFSAHDCVCYLPGI